MLVYTEDNLNYLTAGYTSTIFFLYSLLNGNIPDSL